MSLNREARRLVDGLTNPGQTAEQLLDVLTFRRADGREISLREFPLAEALSTGETVRAEEIVIGVPDGRSVSVLLNATAIRSEEGQVESVVVTLQDMTALEELDRLRAEFLGMVSHELRAPLTSIKGSAATVLGSSADLDPAVVRQFFRIIDEQADHMHDLVADLLDVARIETGTLPVTPEPAEVAVLVDRARSTFTSAGGRNNLAIDIPPDLPLVMADRRRIVQVVGNLLSNAAKHSSESSVITVTAVRGDVHVAVSVADEGRGHTFRATAVPVQEVHPDRRRRPGERRRRVGPGPRHLQGDRGGARGPDLGRERGAGHGGAVHLHDTDGRGGRERHGRLHFRRPASGGGTGGTGAGPGGGRRPPGAQVRPRRPRQCGLHAGCDRGPGGGAPTRGGGEARSGPARPDAAGDRWHRADEGHPGAGDVPVIFVSAYGRDELIARAFDMGAVDYVVKPFSPTELAARIRAALRKRAASEPSAPYVLGDLTIDYAERRVTLAGRPLPLIAMEYRLLAELSANAGRLLTYEHLLERVWGEKSSGDVRPMRTIVSKLRRKLGDDADSPTYIFTEPRVGYRMPQGETKEQEEAM